MMARSAVAAACPNEAAHTDGPNGYVQWHEWAETMAETHVQERCPDCGLWKLWTAKGPVKDGERG